MSTAIPSCVPRTEERYLKSCAVLGSAPCALGATALSRSRWKPYPQRRCGTTTLGNPSDGRSGYRAHLLQDSTRETSTEKQNKRKQKDKQEQGWVGETCASALTRRSGLLAQTRNLSIELLVTTRGFRTLDRPGRLNSSRHAMRLASSLPLDLPLFHQHPRTAGCVSCAWYSCLCAFVHRRVLKISHASVCVPGARVAFPLSVRRG